MKIKYESITECPEIGYLVGAIDGDGSASLIRRSSDNSIQPRISLKAKDKDFIQFFQRCVQMITSNTPNIRYREKSRISPKSKHNYISRRWIISFDSQHLYQTYWTKRIFYAKKYPIQYLQGIFDSEGSVKVSNNRSIQIWLAMTDQKIIQLIKRLLINLQIQSTIKQRKSDQIYKRAIRGGSSKELYKQFIGFRIKRKHERMIGNKLYYSTEVYRHGNTTNSC